MTPSQFVQRLEQLANRAATREQDLVIENGLVRGPYCSAQAERDYVEVWFWDQQRRQRSFLVSRDAIEEAGFTADSFTVCILGGNIARGFTRRLEPTSPDRTVRQLGPAKVAA